jgi:hypothetical protein
MVERFGIKISSGHIDGTSMSVEGKYIQSEKKESSTEDVKEKEGEDEPVAIRINHGYSRDHRADLKQFTFSLLTVGEEGILTFPVKSKIQECKLLDPLSDKDLRHNSLDRKKYPLKQSSSLWFKFQK